MRGMPLRGPAEGFLATKAMHPSSESALGLRTICTGCRSTKVPVRIAKAPFCRYIAKPNTHEKFEGTLI